MKPFHVCGLKCTKLFWNALNDKFDIKQKHLLNFYDPKPHSSNVMRGVSTN